MMTTENVLILGYGRLGAAFSRLYSPIYAIRGVRRSQNQDESAIVVQMPIQDDALRPHLEWANVIIFCPAPERKDIQAYRETYQDNMQFLLNLMGHRPASSLHLIILISSIGVYPRTGDRCWSETDHLFIATPFQEILLATEQAVASRAIPYTILRAGGLYGEGRGYHHRVMQQGYINSSEMSEQWISSVHQDDLCGVIDQVIKQKKIGTIYNLVDQSHLRKRELVAWMAREMELPIVSDGPPTDADSHRRICTTKVMEELGYQFRYPTIIEFLEERKRRDEKPRQRG